MVIRVLIADDNAAVRAALCQRVARDAGLRLVGEAEDGERAVRLALDLRPDVALLDISMPGLNGFDAARRIGGAAAAAGGGDGGAPVRVVALSLHADWQVVVEALRAGAAGYLLKTRVARELGLAVRCVAAGGVYLSEAILEAARLHDGLAAAAPDCPGLLDTLSDDERGALDGLSRGFARAGAGCSAFTPDGTGSHRRALMEKLGMPTFAELMRFALQRQMKSAASGGAG